MARTDYTKEQRDAWQSVRLAGERARGQHSAGVNKLPRAPNPFGREGSIAKAVNEPIAATTKAKTIELSRQLVRKAPKHSTLTADVPSQCFELLQWRDGIATGVFARNGAEYSWPCDRDTFIDWCSDSLGQFFNAEIR